MSEFGNTFKARREAKGLSLEQIATETRINTRFLQAIEHDDFQVLPGGIFSRGFVRAYAEVLGMDPEKAVADFERVSNYHEPLLEGLRVSTPQPSKRNLILYPIAAGVLVLVIVIFYLVTRDRPVTVNPDPPKPSVAAPETAVSPPAAVPAAVEPPPPPSPPPPETTQPKAPLTLAVEVREPTWVKITTDGTSAVPGVILQPGTTRSYTAQNSISIAVGNAAGLSLKINDRPLRPLGRSGQVRTITITPANIKDITG